MPMLPRGPLSVGAAEELVAHNSKSDKQVQLQAQVALSWFELQNGHVTV